MTQVLSPQVISRLPGSALTWNLTDNVATISDVITQGYLSALQSQGNIFLPVDAFYISYVGGSGLFKPSFSANLITLISIDGNDIQTLTGNSGGAIQPSGGNINIVGTKRLLVSGSGNTLTIIPDESEFLPPNFIQGFKSTWNNVGPPATVTVSSGTCLDSTNSYKMILAAPVTLAVTNIDTGSFPTAGQWVFTWLFGKTTDATDTTLRFSISGSAPTPPAGYNIKRIVGCVKAVSVSAPNICGFLQSGDGNILQYDWTSAEPTLLILQNGHSNTPVLFSCAPGMSPLSDRIAFNSAYAAATAGNVFYLYSPSASADSQHILISTGEIVSGNVWVPLRMISVGANQTLMYKDTQTGENLNLLASGYMENR